MTPNASICGLVNYLIARLPHIWIHEILILISIEIIDCCFVGTTTRSGTRTTCRIWINACYFLDLGRAQVRSYVTMGWGMWRIDFRSVESSEAVGAAQQSGCLNHQPSPSGRAIECSFCASRCCQICFKEALAQHLTSQEGQCLLHVSWPHLNYNIWRNKGRR